MCDDEYARSMKTNTRGPNQGTIANALVPILVVRLKFNRADELDKLWIEVEDVEEAVGENPERGDGTGS